MKQKIRFLVFAIMAMLSINQVWGADMTIDFESATSTYSDWTFNNVSSAQTTITAHSGSKHGQIASTSGYIVTKNAISNPSSITFYVSKSTNNTTSSNWKVQVSTNNSSWTDVKTQSATSMSKGTWVEVTQSLSTYSNVYVRVYYSGSNAVRCIDDLTLSTGAACTEPATALSITSAATATVGTPLSLTTAGGNGGTVTWSVTNGTGSATVNGSTLNPATAGTVTVKAHQDQNGTTCEQDAEKTVTISKQATTITLSEAGSETNVSGTHYVGDSYTLPSTTSASCGSKVLVGWSTVAIPTAGAKPVSNYYEKGASVTLGATNKFYAVFADASAGGTEEWVEITSEPDAGTYAILCDSYFMKAGVASSRFQNGSEMPSITSGKLNSAPAEDCQWEISKPDTYYRIQNGTNYAGGTNSKNQGALLTDASADLAKWSISYVTDHFEIINYGRSQASTDSGNKYLRNNTTNGWATYTSGTGTAPRLFRKTGGITYTNYTTTCGPATYTASVAGGLENGSINLNGGTDDVTDEAGTEITLSYEANQGYEFSAWVVKKKSDNSYVTSTVVAGNTLTLPAYDVTVSATFTCVTPTFSVNLSTAEVSYSVGDVATPLSVTAAAGTGTIGYQWQESTNGTDGWTNVAANGTSQTYTPSTASAGTKYYRCVVSNTSTGCSTTATSAVAHITVNSSVKYHIFVCPADVWGGSYDNGGVSINYEKNAGGWTMEAMTLTGFTDAGKKIYGYEMSVNPNTDLKTLQFVNHGDYYGAANWGNSADHVYRGWQSDQHKWTDLPAPNNASAVYLVGSFNGWANADVNYQLTKQDVNHFTGEFVLNGAAENYQFKVYAVDVPTGWGYQFSANGYYFQNDATTATQLWSNNNNDQIVPLSASERFVINVEYYGQYSNHGQLTITREAMPVATFAKGDEAVTGDIPADIKQLKGTNITLPANPFTWAGHSFAGWSDGENTYAAGATYEMPAGGVTFTATWTDIRILVTWSINGNIDTKTYLNAAGPLAELPADPASCDGEKQFVGWTNEANKNHDSDVAPAVLYKTKEDIGNISTATTFYAVFANVVGGGSVTDVLTYEKTGVVNTNTSNDAYIGFDNVSDQSAAKYAGQINAAKNKGTFEFIQLRSTNPSGIVSTVSGGNVSSVVVAWHSSTTASRQIDVYGSNTAYTSGADLYDSEKKGTLIGSLYANHTDNGTTTTIDNISGEYAYIGIRSNNGALYLSTISVTYGGATISGYTTKCSTDPTIVVDPTSITGLGYVENYGGTNNTAKTFTVGGRFLTENVTVAAGDNYEVSLDGSSYAANQTTTKNVNTTVHVRLKAGKALGDYNADAAANKITCSSAGADAQTISLSGSVVAKELQSIAINAGSTHKTTYTLGEDFDPSGLKIDATYNSGVEVITYDGSNMTFSKEGAITASDATVQVTFDGKNANISLTLNCSVEWLVKGVAYTKGVAVSSVALNGTVSAPSVDPTSADCDGSKVFMGWIAADEDYENETTAPTGMFTETSGTISQNTTFRAVFATSKGYGNTFTKFTGATLESGQYLFVEEYNGTYARMARVLQAKTGTPTTYYLAGIVTTVTDGKIDLSDNADRDMTVYVVTKNGDNYTIANLYNQQQGENAYLNIDGTTLLYGATGTNYTVEYGAKGWQFTSTASGTNTKLSAYYSNPNYRFNAYGSFSNTLHLFKRDGGFADYTTDCVAAYDITYECDGATSGCPANLEDQMALPNELATPTKTGFDFGGWYTNSDKTIAVVAGAALTSDVTLYAKWIPVNPGTVTITGTYHYFAGETIELTATPANTLAASGVTYTWLKNIGGNWTAVDGQTTNVLRIENCIADNAGNYKCTISNNGAESTSDAYDVKILKMYMKYSDLSDKESGTFTKIDKTTAYVDFTLDEGLTYKFSIVDGLGHNYGNTGTMTEGNSSDWAMDVDGNCGITTTLTGRYRFTVNYSELANLVVSVTYPNPNQAGGYNIYFDNSKNWSTVFYRIGNGESTIGQALTPVPGTARLYQTTSREFEGYLAWQIGNNTGWTLGNDDTPGANYSIYYNNKHDGEDGTNITASTEFQKSFVPEGGATLTISGEPSSGTASNNNNCGYYSTARYDGLLTHNVAISGYANGSVTVSYTDIADNAQNLTSGNADLAHTCILTINASANTGYHMTSLTVNGGDFTSGNTHVLEADATIAATFVANQSAITFNANGGEIDGEETKVLDYTYGGASLVLPTPTKTGFAFVGWYTATTDGTLIDNVGGANKPAAAVEYFAIWRELAVISFEVPSGVAAVANIYEGETFPSAANISDCGDAGYDYTFVGWVTEAIAEETATAPGTIYEAGATCELGTTQTLKALYKRMHDVSFTWTEVSNISNIQSGETYLILTNDKSKAYNGQIVDLSSSKHFGVAEVTYSSAPFNTSSASEVVLTSVGINTYTIKDANNKYLVANGKASGKAGLANSDSYGWKFSGTTSLNAVYQATDKDANLRSYDNATFRTYSGTSNGNPFFLAKKVYVREARYLTNISCAKRQPESLALTGEYPTMFDVNEAFSHEGMTVTATYDNGDEADVTASATFVDNTTGEAVDMTTAGSKTIKVSYTENGGTATTTYTITIQQTYTVTYAANGATSGTVPVNSNKYHTGDKVTVEGNTGNLDKTGNTFGGWSYGGNTYQADEQVTVGTENVTLTAVWNAKTAAILTLNVKGVETPLAGTHYVDDVVALPTTVSTSVVGYTFVGWSSVEISTPATKPAENYFAKGADYTLAAEAQTLYAVYARGTGAMTKYSAELITEAEDIVDGGKYIIEQADHAAINTITNNKLQTTATYNKSNLTGDEDYVWTLKTGSAVNTYRLVSVDKKELKVSSNDLSLVNAGGSDWTFTYPAVYNTKEYPYWKISSTNFLGFAGASTYEYKAYANGNYNLTKSNEQYAAQISMYRLMGNYTTDPFAGYKAFVEADGATWNTEGTHSYQDMSDGTKKYINVDELITTGEPTTAGLWYEFNLEDGRSWPEKSGFTVQMAGADVDWDYEFGTEGEAYLYLMAPKGVWTGDVYIHLEACDGSLAAPEVVATATPNGVTSSLTLTWPAVAEANYEATLNTSIVVTPVLTDGNYTATFNNLHEGETYNWQVVVSKGGCLNMASGSETITACTITGIEVTTDAHRTYTEGETLVKETVVAHYSNCADRDITELAEFTYDLSIHMEAGYAYGTKTVTVSYDGQETSYEITVNEIAKYYLYVDDLQETNTVEGVNDGKKWKGSHKAPSIPDKDVAAEGDCATTHYHFVGWYDTEADDDFKWTDGKKSNIKAAGATMSPNSGSGVKTYYAVWAEDTNAK